MCDCKKTIIISQKFSNIYEFIEMCSAAVLHAQVFPLQKNGMATIFNQY